MPLVGALGDLSTDPANVRLSRWIGSDGRMASTIALLFQINSSLITRDRFALADHLADVPVPENKIKKKEGPMTTAGQALLSAGELFCLSFAAIPLVYFADRLRSGF